MTDHSDLIERLEKAEGSDTLKAVLLGMKNAEMTCLEAAAALREQQAEIERLREELTTALEIERQACGHRAREIAEHYPEASDGRNTFIILAEQIESNNIGRNVAAVRAALGKDGA